MVLGQYPSALQDSVLARQELAQLARLEFPVRVCLLGRLLASPVPVSQPLASLLQVLQLVRLELAVLARALLQLVLVRQPSVVLVSRLPVGPVLA